MSLEVRHLYESDKKKDDSNDSSHDLSNMNPSSFIHLKNWCLLKSARHLITQADHVLIRRPFACRKVDPLKNGVVGNDEKNICSPNSLKRPMVMRVSLIVSYPESPIRLR